MTDVLGIESDHNTVPFIKGGLNDIAGTQWILDIQNESSMPLTSIKLMH